MTFLFINVNHDVGPESSESIPISQGYILATLKEQGWDGIIVDDLRGRALSLNVLEKWIRRIEPQIIGFTAYRSTMDRIRFLCRYIKSRHRKIRVMLGGPQAVRMPPTALEHLEDVDILVRGEGELVTAAIAKAIDADEPLETVEGIVCRCEGRIVDTGTGPKPPIDLDEYASPYVTGLLNLEGKDTAILLSSRGCSHVCRFCITPSICGGKVRFHSVERTIAEMELLAGQGIERFWFADPNFTEDRERTLRLMETKQARGIQTPFWFQTRSDLIDASLLQKLREAGADTIAFGLESGSPGVLAGTNKQIVLEQLRENVKTAQSLGVETELFTIFGLPGETVESARETLEFVKSLGIPIQSNSGSQQMQLYFGSIYEKNPPRWGFRPFSQYRAQYMAIGDEYETETMSKQELKKVRNMWVLANEKMERDVYFKQHIFEVLDFLLENQQELEDETSFYVYGALASSALEEFDILLQFLEGLQKHTDGHKDMLEEVISALSFFKESDQPIGPMDRVIFDSRSFLEGVPFTGISGKFWDVLLGRGLLLPSFEEGFVGARQGDEISFDFVFPDDYVQEELRGKKVEVQAKIHKVFQSVEAKSIDEVKNLNIQNTYPVSDLDTLREQNEILYYLALRRSDPRALAQTPSHFLMLVHQSAKLGKREVVEELARALEQKPKALKALADTLMNTGKFAWALPYYEKVSDEIPSAQLKRVQCLLHMVEPERALSLIETLPEGKDLEFYQTLLECLKRARPASERIPSLEHHVMDLKVNAALDREMLSRRIGNPTNPIVHGLHAEE
jgi:radical SAM superfamily enzyme YgiQ (UPF0313 family)